MPGVDLARRRLAGLLEELEHRAVLVAADEAVGRGVLDRMQADRRARPALLVVREQGASRSRSVRTSPLRARKRSPSSSPSSVGGEADRARGAQRLGLGDVADPGRRSARPRRAPRAATSGRKPQASTTSSTPWRGEPLDHVGEEGPVDQGQRRLRHDRSAAAAASPRRRPGRSPASSSGGCRRPCSPRRSGRSPRRRSPALRSASGSRKLRPSTISGRAIRLAASRPVELGELAATR